jgi:hypothetical protein
MLDGRDVLPAGLGLAAFMLIRFPAPGSGTELVLRPKAEPPTLLGPVVFFTAADPFGGFAAGGGCSMIEVIAIGRTNIPRPISQSKYLSPLTLPSFLPLSSSSSTPTQSSEANRVCPTNRTVAMRPSLSWTVWPTASSAMLCKSLGRFSQEV